jgi:hypothetical protein
MVVLMDRTYIFRRVGISRARAALAALAAGALLAGCGGGGGSTTPAAGASPAATPVVSSSGIQAEASSGSSGGGAAVAGSIAGGLPASQLSSGKTGSLSTSSTGSFSSSSGATYSHTTNSVVSASQVKQQQNAAAKLLKNAASTNSATKTVNTKTITSSTSTPTKVQSPPKQVTTTAPKTVVRYVTRYKTRVVYRTHTRTVTKTVVKTVVKPVKVSPDIPVGAFLPSKHPQLAQSSFAITGTNIGCEIARATVRCGIQQRAWAAPLQPSSCKGSWGDTIQLGGSGMPKFACGGSDPISTRAKVIPAGWDDKVGNVTCEIRSFGVNCFSTGRSGFMISRTGYSLY